MAGTTRLELATSAVTGQRSNQLNYVPSRGITVESTTCRKALRNETVASFAYSARSALCVKECGCFRRNRPQTAYKSLCAHASFILTQMPARGEREFDESSRKVGSSLGSAAKRADAKQTEFCTYLSGILLGGL